MNFHCYIIDDQPEKVALLPTFLTWLKSSFPEHNFHHGFTIEPETAAYRSKDLLHALNDPFGFILLDANLDEDALRFVALEVMAAFDLLPADVTELAGQLANSPSEVALGAAIYLAAKKNSCRLAWISHYDTELTTQVAGLDRGCPNIRWPKQLRAPWDNSDKDKLSVVLRLFHPDSVINEAVAFAIQPPIHIDGFNWHHNLLKEGEAHNGALAAWLEFDTVHGESAKALLCGNEDWTVNKVCPRAPRMIQVGVFAKTCERLAITINTSSFNDEDLVPVPCEPFLPFLMTLRALIHEMDRCEKFHAPDEITLVNVGTTSLRLKLRNCRKDAPGESVDMSAFKAALEEASLKQDCKQHLTTARLADIIHARLSLLPSKPGQPLSLFAGTVDATVSITFDEDRNDPAIIITWPPQFT